MTLPRRRSHPTWGSRHPHGVLGAVGPPAGSFSTVAESCGVTASLAGAALIFLTVGAAGFRTCGGDAPAGPNGLMSSRKFKERVRRAWRSTTEISRLVGTSETSPSRAAAGGGFQDADFHQAADRLASTWATHALPTCTSRTPPPSGHWRDEAVGKVVRSTDHRLY